MTRTGDSADLVPSHESSPVPRTAVPASAWETVDELVAAVADADRAIHAMTAWRTVLIDQARQLGEAVQRVTQTEPSPAADIPRRTMIAELACALRVTERSMGALVDNAEILVDRLPGTLEAMRRGDLSARHADVIIETTADLDPSDRADAEQHLVGLACRQNPARFRTTARRWRERHHPRDLTERHREARQERCVVLDPAADGMAWLSALLPVPQAWAMFDRLDAAVTTLHGPDEPRTTAQLRADVLADLVLDPQAAAVLDGAQPDAGAPAIRTSVNVTVPVLTLLRHGDEPGHLEGYGPIDAQTARELAADAPSFTRLLTDPGTGTVLSVGRDRYTVPADMRRFLRVRDETCRFPGCGRRAARCDVDHTQAWEHDGHTECDNLAHLCRHHHRLKHRGGWTVTSRGGGTLDWTSPAGRDYTTDPALPIADAVPSTDPAVPTTGNDSPGAHHDPPGRPDCEHARPDGADPPAPSGRRPPGPTAPESVRSANEPPEPESGGLSTTTFGDPPF